MFDVAGQVQTWLSRGERVCLARTMSVEGMSSRWSHDAAATGDLGAVGEVLGGAASDQLTPILRDAAAFAAPAHIHEVTVGDAQAKAAGLSCGGSARVLVQPARDIPDAARAALAERRPACLVTEIDGDHIGRTSWFGVGDPADGHDPEIVRWFGRGITATAVMSGESGRQVLVSALWPTTRLLVVGDGLLATALCRTAETLGWQPETTVEVEAAVATTRTLAGGDAIVVLTHSRQVDGPVLAAALASKAGYIGALGSRRTQAARAAWLAEHGVMSDAVQLIRGPAGLDIGARTPAEIALSIVAEIVSVRTGAGGQALRDRSGPIHVDGLRTPPARYEVAKPRT